MPKLSSLADLAALLPAGADSAVMPSSSPSQPSNLKMGYDGKPQRLTISTAKRTGTKTVTVVRGFQSRPEELDVIFATLKKRCGAGGKLLDNEIEVQGDHRAAVRDYLTRLGFRVQGA